MDPTAVLLLSCPDRPGIVAAVADFVFRHGGNVLDAQQYTDRTDGVFFQRVEFALDGFDLPREVLSSELAPLVADFGMQCTVRFSDDVPRGRARLEGRSLSRRPAGALRAAASCRSRSRW